MIGSIVAFIVGTSCCWLSALAIWLGGIGFLSVIINMVEDFQMYLIVLSIIFGFISIYLYQKNKTKN